MNNKEVINHHLKFLPAAHFMLPDIASASNSITSGQSYFYQSKSAHCVKLMSDFLVTLSTIKNTMLLEGVADSNDVFALNDASLLRMACRDMSSLLRVADHSKLFKLFQSVVSNHSSRDCCDFPRNVYLARQFSRLLAFAKDTASQQNQRDWNSRLETYLLRDVLNGNFPCDVWINIAVELIIEYNRETVLLDFPHSALLFNQGMAFAMERVTLALLNVTAKAAPNDVVGRCQVINELAMDKLALCNAMHFVSYLNHWMVVMETNMDIHVFLNRQVLHHAYDQKYVMELLQTRGVLKEQLVIVGN